MISCAQSVPVRDNGLSLKMLSAC